MDIKIIASDLDGTLMAPDHQTVTERTKAALLKAHEKGIKIAIATGRTLSLIKEVAAQIPAADYIIYSNGASVFDCGENKTIYKEHISGSKAEKIVRLIDKMPVFYNVYYNGNMYYKKNGGVFSGGKEFSKEFLEHFSQLSIQEEDMVSFAADKECEMIIIYGADENCREQILDLMNELGGLGYVSSVMNNIEITASKASKGSALNAICNKIGCTAKEAMAFGDALNDCSMLSFAENSFAMENGDDACKKAAKFITPSNGQDGVAQAIEKYAL